MFYKLFHFKKELFFFNNGHDFVAILICVVIRIAITIIFKKIKAQTCSLLPGQTYKQTKIAERVFNLFYTDFFLIKKKG